MASARASSIAGYAAEVATLIKQYESIRFEDVHRQLLHLIPTARSRVLDIGAGTGRDAAALAAMGHDVVAVEPTAELRVMAAALHRSPSIEWLDDSLPNLPHLTRRAARFDVVMLTAVWMHLDKRQRRAAMQRVAPLVASGGVMMMSLRHGPVPPGRRMFEVATEETIRLAETAGLNLTLSFEHQDGLLSRPGVSWTRLGFAKPKNA